MTAPAPREIADDDIQIKEIDTLLAKGSDFEGKLTFEGTVRIDGKFKGEIFSDDVLIIGESAHVEAEIDIGGIVIHGTMIGNVRASRVIKLLKPARVRGDLTTPSLQVERGVIFEGRSFMENAVEKVAGKKPAAAPAGKPQESSAKK